MNGIFDWFDMSAPYQEQVKEYQETGNAPPSLINDFKQRSRDWALKVVELVNTEVPGPLQPEKRKMLDRAKIIKQGIEGVFGTMDEFEGVGLGVIPLIPIAVIGASLAAITKWTLDFKKFMAAVTEQRRLESTGMPPAQAAEIARQGLTKPFISIDFKKLLLPALVVGGGLWYFSRKRR